MASQNLKTNSELYKAMMSEDDEKVIHICRGISKGPLHTPTIHEDSVLHMAIFQKKTDLALKLLDMLSSCDNHKLTWQNSGGNTVLHETGTNNKCVDVAKEILVRAPMLLNMTNKEGETALFYAARHGKTDIYMFLHEEVCRATQGPDLKTYLRRDDRFTILHIAILSRNYRVACDIAENHRDLIGEKDADGMTALQLLSIIKPQFRPKGLFKRIIFKVISTEVDTRPNMCSFVRKLKKEKHACHWAMKIAGILIKQDRSWETTESWTDNRGSNRRGMPEKKMTTAHDANYLRADTPLLLATIHNSTEIVSEILKMYPQAVEHVDKDGRNILHLAILHRRHEIIDVVENMEYPVVRLRGRLDKKYNTVLHMVSHKVDDLKEDVRHPAQELKEDQYLFKRVEELTTTLDRSTRNVDQKTAYEVFVETNDHLRTQAKALMIENAKNCIIVAVLIATVAFASAYTVPGGLDENGHPVLKHKPMFLIFTIADACSLSTALASAILFLNIVTSSFQFKDFASYLFEKQLTALILLIISVATMMVAFAATLILTISNHGTWSDMTLYCVSFFPVILFVYLYISDYLDTIHGKFKKMIKKVAMGFHKICNCKPTDETVHITSASPV